MARLRQYTKGNVSLLDKVVGTDVENQYNTINISLASIVDLAVQYFSTNGGGDAINQSLFSLTESIENNSIAIASYNQSISTNTSNIAAITTRTETLESVFSTDVDGNLTISAANISNLAETVAAEGFASATQVNAVDSRVDNIIDGSTVLSTYATNTQLQTTESTLEGSIATTENNLTAAYEAYTDGALTNYSTTTATQGLIANATADMASASFVTNLASSLGTTDSSGNLTVSEAFANSVLNTETTSDFASAQSVTDLTTTVGGNTTSISTNATSITDIEGNVSGSYGVTVDANGSIAGLQLLSDGTTSSMKFAADQFKFTNGSGTLTPFSIDTVNNKINLTGDVVFSSGGSYGDSDVQSYIDTVGEIFTSTTTISGGQIETGLIKNSTYPHSAGHSGYATTGMAIDLDNGSIHAEEFFVDSDGSSSFSGSHTAGSVGSWVVDSSGSLQSSASNPAIVLSPSSSAGTDSASEKIRISATSLPSIAPFGASSLNFASGSSSGIVSSNAAWSSATSGNNSSSGHTYTKYVSMPDRTFYVDAAQTSSNTSYTQPLDGNVNITVPYNETTTMTFPYSSSSIKAGGFVDFVVNEEFLYSHGVRWSQYYDEGDEVYYRSISNPNHARYDIIEFDYEISLAAQIYRKSGSTKTAVGGEKVQLLDSGTDKLSTDSFSPIDGSYAQWMNISQAEMDSWDFHHASTYFGLWENGSANFSEYLTAGDYVIDFRLKIKVFNTKIWGTSTHTDTGTAVVNPRYRYEIVNNTYNGAGASSFELLSGSSGVNSGLTTIVFKNSVPKTSIGINGFQIRGGKGYIALGDATSTNAVAQLWGDTEVVGTLSANTVTTLSDKRFKTNIRPISDPIGIAKALNPVRYNWDFGRYPALGLKHGFIAQEVLGVVPSAVQKNQKTGALEDGMTLEYNNFIAINTAAIKKLIEKIEALEAEIETLKQTNG